MRQKFLFLSFLIILSCMFAKANAQIVMVSALDEISTAKPAKTVSVKLVEPLKISNEQILSSDVILTGTITDVKPPKRLKRNAKFSFETISYKNSDDEICELSHIKAKYKQKLNRKDLAKKAALTAGGHFVKGLAPGFALVEGAIKNEDGNVVKSSFHSLYKSSPVSCIEKGNEICIKPGQYFYLQFPKVDSDTRQKVKIKQENNDSYTIEKE